MTFCEFCLLPRPAGVNPCPVCGHEATGSAAPEGGDERALRLIREGLVGEAYSHLEHEAAAGRESSENCRILSWLAFSFGDARAVEIWSHEALRLGPESPEPHILMAYALDLEERWAEANDEYAAALKRRMTPARRELVLARQSRVKALIPEW
jgi:hypothetical protein